MLGIYFLVSVVIAAWVFFNKSRVVRHFLLVLFLLVQWAVSVYGFVHLHEEELGYFTFDAAGIIFLFVLSLLSITTVYHSIKYLDHRQEKGRRRQIYFAALIGLIVAMSGVYLASHVGVMWVFVEATTLCVSVLIYHERTALALEATWKYVFICSIGVAIAFVGIIFLSGGIQESGSINLSFQSVHRHMPHANIFWLKLAFLFMVLGFSTKMGLFPMHPICVDAHTVAPPPISAFISTALMNVGFITIFRTYSLLTPSPIQSWMNQILLWSGLLSVFVSAVYLMRVHHLKRMSAYSSLEHMGIAAIGIAAGGIGTFAAILHLVLHAFTKASIFYQVHQVHRTYGSYLVNETGNYFQKNLPGALVMLFAFIGISAIPPSGLFITEFRIMQALFQSSHYLIPVLALLLLTFTIYGFGRNVFALLFSVQAKMAAPQIEGDKAPVSPKESISQFILLAFIIYLGFNPPAQLTDLINEAVINLP